MQLQMGFLLTYWPTRATGCHLGCKRCAACCPSEDNRQLCTVHCGQAVWDIVATVIWEMFPNLFFSWNLLLSLLLIIICCISPCRDLIPDMESSWALQTHSPLPSVREKCDWFTLCYRFQVFVTCFAACVTEPPCCMTAMNEVADCMTPKPQDPRVYRSYSAQICAPSCPSAGGEKKKESLASCALCSASLRPLCLFQRLLPSRDLTKQI